MKDTPGVVEALPEDRREQQERFAHELRVQRFLQPDDVTCGPTCLRKVYDFFGVSVGDAEVLGEIDRNEDGGTLAVFLGISALKRGFAARIYSYDLRRIGLDELHKLPEYDALFIRALTGASEPAFQFALRVEELGMLVVDDSQSIIR